MPGMLHQWDLKVGHDLSIEQQQQQWVQIHEKYIMIINIWRKEKNTIICNSVAPFLEKWENELKIVK